MGSESGGESRPDDEIPANGCWDFSQYRPLFWKILARLIGRGYVIAPDEGQDLIHDFYAEAWADVVRRYDPAKSGGNERRYLYGTFYRFALRRIHQQLAWRQRLQELNEISASAHLFSTTPDRVAEDRELHSKLLRAMKDLPAMEKQLLEQYLRGPGSERFVAREHGLSRYGLREKLIDAVGRVAAALSRWSDDEPSSRIARELWVNGRSVRDTAAVLGIEAGEVRRVRRQLGNALIEASRGY